MLQQIEQVEYDELLTDNRPQVPAIIPDVKPKWLLKRLTTKHKRIVQLKVAGLERIDIGQIAGCTKEYVSMLLQQPLVQEYLRELNCEVDQDLKDLTGHAVGTVRTLMNSVDDKVALTAATTVLRANGKLAPSDSTDGVTAEDVVAKLFAISNSNIQINVHPKE